MKSASMLSWLISMVLYGFVASQDDLFVEPPILDHYEANMKPGTNFSINCLSQYAITWKPFKGFTGVYRISYGETPENELRYESTIELINVTHYYAGWFFCVANSTQSSYDYSVEFAYKQRKTDEDIGVSGMFVPVEDFHNLLVRHSDHLIMTPWDNDTFIIPCVSTMPHIQPMLLVDGNEPSTTSFAYYPPFGFVTRPYTVYEMYGKTLTCTLEAFYYGNGAERVELNFAMTYHEPVLTPGLNASSRTQGEELTLLCSIVILKDENFTIEWTLPHENISFAENRVTVSEQTVTDHPTRLDLRIGLSYISVKDVDIGKDDGNYTCEVTDQLMQRISKQIFIDILQQDDDSIDIYTTSGSYRMEVDLNDAAVWRFKYKGNPKPTLEWYDQHDKIITNADEKYMQVLDDCITLVIVNVQFEDSGFYTLILHNSLNSTTTRFELVVKFRPTVSIDVYTGNGVTVMQNSLAKFVCTVVGYPLSRIKWTFSPCRPTSENRKCTRRRRKTIEEKYVRTTETALWTTQTSILELNATEAVHVQCVAMNTHGHGFDESSLRVEDMETPLQIWGVDLYTKIVAGDNVTAICGASVYQYSDVNWYRDYMIKEQKRIDTKNSYRTKIIWTNITTSATDIYRCIAHDRLKNEKQLRTLNITVHEPKRPEIEDPTIQTLTMLIGDLIRLTCNFAGLPVPTIKWHKNGVLVENGDRVTLSADGQTLEIIKVRKEDEGEFKCIGENRVGSAEKLFTVNVTDLPKISNATALPSTALSSISIAWIIAVAVLILVSVICAIYFFAKFRRIRSELESFVNINGKPDCINPDLAVHEQADLLPYDKNYEFPRKQLELGKQLGAGAFGVVMQAFASEILPNEDKTTVAVKMLKQSADNEQIRALMIELKIMIHLGHNLNVVNLLGAVTKNIGKRELMVIVEYCRFGNVQTFLLKHRRSFVNQVNPERDSIDPTILTKEQSCSHDSRSVHNRKVDPSEGPDGRYKETTFMTSTSGSSTAGNDYNDHTRAVTTSDLICWSFQVARGMKYLASRNVLHGDLAARNILLSDDNVVKICDFGLARSLYERTDYIKDGAALLPVKWLAIESICDRVFSTFSDVWSFGIVMWELFSLGETPYPGMELNQEFFLKLKDGHRMEKPKNATQEIYDIMLHCWDADPESRPSFSALEERLTKLLPSEVAMHYIDLNEQYVVMNAKQKGQTDYISTMRPTEAVPVAASPRYRPMQPLLSGDAFNTRNAVSNPGYAESLTVTPNRGDTFATIKKH